MILLYIIHYCAYILLYYIDIFHSVTLAFVKMKVTITNVPVYQSHINEIPPQFLNKSPLYSSYYSFHFSLLHKAATTNFPCFFSYQLFLLSNVSVCLAGYEMLADGSCKEYKRYGIYDLGERNMGIISDDVISLQV